MKNTLETAQKDGIHAILNPLKQKLNKLFRKEQVKKPESKLWNAAFGMSKQDLVEYASEDFRRYMVLGHFNMGNVKKSLMSSDQKDLVDPSVKLGF